MAYLKYLLLVFFFILLGNPCSASDSLIFVSPVDYIPKLSGNFMELRNNHFHTGIDIKSSNGLVGDKIKSVYDGHVSRVKVQSGSYGQVIYIDHPNGYTTVYAHLDSFFPALEKYVSSVQYETESFEVDLYLPDSLFVINRGQEIGRMGTTGHSFGPHLHFEIRETETEVPLNPEAFGFGPVDIVPPVVETLIVYRHDEFGNEISSRKLFLNPLSNSGAKTVDVVKYDSEGIAFGLSMFDQTTGSYNRNGINAYKLFLDDSLKINWKADRYSFDEDRKINGFLDYQLLKTEGIKVYKLFTPQCNALQSFDLIDNGILYLNDKLNHSIKIEVSDYAGNSSTVEFIVQKQDSEPINTYKYSCDTSYSFRVNMFEILFERNTFFNGFDKLEIVKSEDLVMKQRCHRIDIFSTKTAVCKYYKISCPAPSSDLDKWTFVSKDNKGRWISFGSDTTNGKIYTYLDQLGTFYVYKDTVAPSIQLINLNESKSKPWKFKISDNLIPDGKSSNLSYVAKANGIWLRFKYDKKNDLITFDDFERLPAGKIEFILEVTDQQGNKCAFRKELKT